MPCACDQCLQHSKTLGLGSGASSKELIHRAYRDAAKLWHPDRFETDPEQLPEAEEHFKLVQVAYRELTEHQERPVLEQPMLGDAVAEWPAPESSVFADQTAVFVSDPFAPKIDPPQLSFGNVPGCYTAPRLPVHVDKIIAAHLGPGQRALAIIDLSRNGAPGDKFSQFLLLASHGVIVRDQMNLTSMIWYGDLGEINMIDQRRRGKLNFWNKLLETVSGTQQKYALLIYRRNGALFFRLAGQTDDSVKKVVYNFLLRKKYQPQA
jgi:DnaJ domain